ncbi:MAG: hypothetical protein P8X50_09635, partial [Maritimibacter sp.]
MSIFRLIRSFEVASAPERFSAEQRKIELSKAKFLYVLGVLLLIGGAVSLGWWATNTVFPPKPPTQSVSASNITTKDFSGPLHESVISGDLHFDDLRFISFPQRITIYSKMRFSLIPFTGEDWHEGDPIRCFLTSGWLNENMSEEDFATALVKTGLPASASNDTLHIQMLVQEAELVSFEGNAVEVMRDNNLNVAEDAIIVRTNFGKRKLLLKNMYAPYASIGGLFLLFGLIFGALGAFLKSPIQDFERKRSADRK